MSFIRELKRRNVIRVGVAYLAGAWLLIQILETLFPIFGLEESSIRDVVIVLAIAFVPVVIGAWVFQITPEGLVRDSGTARFCDSVNRDPATGALWLGDGHIVVTNTSIGFIQTSGYDIVGSYEQPIGRFGDMSFDVVSTYLDTWDWQEQPGEVPWNCVGVYWNGPCERPRPEWRSNFRATWITPWDASISLLWRYASEIEDYSGLGNDIPSADYLDLSGLWEVRDDIVLRVGVNNVLDEDPPVASFGSGNSWPEMYEALGRYWFAGMTVRL